MLAASADRQTIAFAQAGVSPGMYGRLGCRATQLPQALRAGSFLYEIGISREGAQLAVPSYQGVMISGSEVQNLDEKEIIGVAYHPKRDFVFFAQSGTSAIAGVFAEVDAVTRDGSTTDMSPANF